MLYQYQFVDSMKEKKRKPSKEKNSADFVLSNYDIRI